MIQMIGCAITMVVIYVVIRHLHNKDNVSKEKESSHYVIKVPSALSLVYSVMFWMGIVLFVLWGIFYLRGVKGLTVGHFVFALVVAGIGLAVLIYSSRWRITVDENKITIHRLLRKELSLYIEELDVEVQEKMTKMGYSARLLLRKDGKKLTTVNWSCENYTQFENDLIKAAKLPENNVKRNF